MAIGRVQREDAFGGGRLDVVAGGSAENSEAQRVLDYVCSLGAWGREANSTALAGQSLAATLAVVVDLLGLESGLLLSAHETEGRLLPVAAHGLATDALGAVEIPEALRRDFLRRPRPWPFRSLPLDLSAFVEASGNGRPVEDRSVAVPLVAGGELVGLFLFEHPAGLHALSERQRQLLGGLCQNLAVHLHHQLVQTRLTQTHRERDELCGRIKGLYRQAIMAFLTAIDIKDGYTKEHSLRVAQIASVLARDLNFSEHEVEGIYFAGLLHDIGKILVDKEILTKPGSLDLTEYAAMSEHTQLGAQILSHIRFPWDNLLDAIRYHHDRPDCGGAPRSPGRNTHQTQKIIGLTDAFDAMTSDRPYRKALTLRGCFGELVRGLGVQFDPDTTHAFLETLQRDLARPPRRRRILLGRLLRGGSAAGVRKALAETRAQVGKFISRTEP